MNELKEQFMLCNDRKKICDIKSKLIKLENIRLCMKMNNKPPISQSVKFIIDGSECRFMSDNESSDEEYMEVPHTYEKSCDYFNFLKYTIPAHYDGAFD